MSVTGKRSLSRTRSSLIQGTGRLPATLLDQLYRVCPGTKSLAQRFNKDQLETEKEKKTTHPLKRASFDFFSHLPTLESLRVLLDIYPEEKEAGEGGAFPARGDRCCRVITPDHMGLGRQRPSFVVRAGERKPNLLRPPHTNFSFTRRIEAKQ